MTEGNNLWDAVKGSRVADWLAGQVATGSVPHAWLFVGPAGSGKKSAAVALAAALICPERPGIGCGSCSTCLRVGRHRHPDVHHVVPEGPLIPVDVIRESVIPEAARSPFEALHKVFVIEEAERMNDAAQNALLKTLEEPQPDTVFVLLSDRESELLETIRSRCRVVRFDPISEERVVALLEEAGLDETEALLAARLAEGNLERARAIALDESARERRHVWTEIPRRLTTPVDAFAIAADISSVAKDAVKERESAQKAEVVELAEAMGEGRGTAAARNALAKRHKRELRRFEETVLSEALSAIATWYRDVLAVRSGASSSVSNLDQLEELEKWSAADLDEAALVAAVERCIAARASLVRNANASLAVEAALVELARLVPPPDPLQSATRSFPN